MLKTRIITAALLAPLIVGCIYFAPGWLYAVVFGLATAAAASEWAMLTGLSSNAQRVLYTLVFALLALAIYIWPQVREPLLWAAAAFWILALYRVVRFRGDEPLAELRLFDSLLGLIVIGGAFAALLELRWGTDGAHWVMLSLSLVWLADIGAYFAGRRFGRLKLLPRVSPGKTWEGVAGGMAAAVLVLITALLAWREPITLWLLAIPPLVLLSVLGDLFESTLKRRAGVKDSGTLLPGHGGMLDRIDAQLAVLPYMALLLGHWVHNTAGAAG